MAIGNVYQRFLPGMANLPTGPRMPTAPQAHYYGNGQNGFTAQSTGGTVPVGTQTSPFMNNPFSAASSGYGIINGGKSFIGNVNAYNDVANAYGYTPTAAQNLGAGLGFNGGAPALQTQLATQHAINGANPALQNSIFGQGGEGQPAYNTILPGLNQTTAGSAPTMPTPALDSLRMGGNTPDAPIAGMGNGSITGGSNGVNSSMLSSGQPRYNFTTPEAPATPATPMTSGADQLASGAGADTVGQGATQGAASAGADAAGSAGADAGSQLATNATADALGGNLTGLGIDAGLDTTEAGLAAGDIGAATGASSAAADAVGATTAAEVGAANAWNPVGWGLLAASALYTMGNAFNWW